MANDRRVLAGALILTLALAACGGSGTAPAATTAPGAASAAAPTPVPATEAPAPTEQPSAAPTEAGGGSSGPLTDLAALLPETVGDVTYERVGFDGDQLGLYGAMAGVDSEQLDPVLEKYGKTVNDVDFAIASSSSNQAAGMVLAMRLEGVPAAELMGSMSLEASDMETRTVAGKQVWTAGGGGFGMWVYPKDDILFMIVLASDEIAEGLVAQLP